MVRLKMRSLQIGVAVALVLALCASPALCHSEMFDEDGTPFGMFFDLIVLRPVGLAAQVIGGAFFIVSLPFSAFQGNVQDVAQKMVSDPAKFTWARPIGQLDEW